MSESAEVKRGLLGRTRPLLSCTLRLRWLESVCAPRHFVFHRPEKWHVPVLHTRAPAIPQRLVPFAMPYGRAHARVGGAACARLVGGIMRPPQRQRPGP